MSAGSETKHFFPQKSKLFSIQVIRPPCSKILNIILYYNHFVFVQFQKRLLCFHLKYQLKRSTGR